MGGNSETGSECSIVGAIYRKTVVRDITHSRLGSSFMGSMRAETGGCDWLALTHIFCGNSSSLGRVMWLTGVANVEPPNLGAKFIGNWMCNKTSGWASYWKCSVIRILVARSPIVRDKHFDGWFDRNTIIVFICCFNAWLIQSLSALSQSDRPPTAVGLGGGYGWQRISPEPLITLHTRALIFHPPNHKSPESINYSLWGWLALCPLINLGGTSHVQQQRDISLSTGSVSYAYNL